jgi:hypothetical protein
MDEKIKKYRKVKIRDPSSCLLFFLQKKSKQELEQKVTVV